MGFWDSFKEFGKEMGGEVKKSLKERAERINGYKEKYSQMDDDTLLRFFRNTSRRTEERMVILQILRERGYGVDED